MTGYRRNFTVTLLLLGALICSKSAEALDCPMVPPASWYHAADGSDTPAEKQRQDAEVRAALETLERIPIIFRGRLAPVRYLTDPNKTNVPVSLLVFDQVEILKGRLFTASVDRKAFVIKEDWCDFSCKGKTAGMAWPRGTTVVIGAHRNGFVDPSKAVDFDSKRVIYKGRIDAVLGMCNSSPTAKALELLKAPADEIARLKREYQLRIPNQRSP